MKKRWGGGEEEFALTNNVLNFTRQDLFIYLFLTTVTFKVQIFIWDFATFLWYTEMNQQMISNFYLLSPLQTQCVLHIVM